MLFPIWFFLLLFCCDFIAHVITDVHGSIYITLSNSMLTVIISEALKNILRRPRPSKASISKRVLPIRDDVTNPAFPSGDSAQVLSPTSIQPLGCSVCCMSLPLLWQSLALSVPPSSYDVWESLLRSSLDWRHCRGNYHRIFRRVFSFEVGF